MATYECSECGGTAVERDYSVTVVEVMCPECDEFCPHVNLEHPRVQALLERTDVEATASAVVAAVLGRG